MTDRETLAARIEAADASVERAMLEEAFAFIHKMYGGLAPADWSALHWPFVDRFTAKLDAEAYLDAAMMLVPDGMFARIYCEGPQAIIVKHGGSAWQEVARSALTATPALALAAAAIRAGGSHV